jgi:hypothetical protein
MIKVKEKKELIKTLLDEGYLPNAEGNWIVSTTEIGFCCKMFQFCGKEPCSSYYWKDSWLEEKEEELTDDEIWNSIWKSDTNWVRVLGHNPVMHRYFVYLYNDQHYVTREWFKGREHRRIKND